MTKRALLAMLGAVTWPARVYGAGGWLLIVVMAAFLLFGVAVFAGCGGGGNTVDHFPGGGSMAPTSQPGGPDGSISVAAGNAIVSKLDTALARIDDIKLTVSDIKLSVSATATLQGLGNYSSQFGVGAATCVAAALTIVLLAVWRVCAALREVILRLCKTIDLAVAAMAGLLRLDELGDQQRELLP